MPNRHANLALMTAALLLGAGPFGCGSNAFKAAEPGDPAEDAAIALEKDQADDAIEVLEKGLKDDPSNARYLSMLSSAYAQRAGVEPIRFAQKMSDSEGEGDSGGGGLDLVALYPLLPAPTTKVLSDIDRAVEILAVDMQVEQYQTGDTFKLGLFQTASFTLHTKKLDKNGDGKISLDEAGTLTAESAAALLAQILAAQGQLAGDANDPKSQAAAKALEKFQGQIDAAPGDTQEEKLRNVIANNKTATSTLTLTATSTLTSTSIDTSAVTGVSLYPEE